MESLTNKQGLQTMNTDDKLTATIQSAWRRIQKTPKSWLTSGQKQQIIEKLGEIENIINL